MIANVIPTTATTLTASTNSLSVWLSQVPSSGFEGGHSQHSLWNLSCQETEREWRSAPHFLQRHPRKQPVGESFSKCNSSERVKIYLKKQQCNEADADNSINMVTTALLHVWETNSVKRSVFFFVIPSCTRDVLRLLKHAMVKNTYQNSPLSLWVYIVIPMTVQCGDFVPLLQ